MSDHNSDPGVTPSSKKGGNRTAGQRSEKNQARRTAAIKSTKEIWGVSEYQDIFPDNIKPVDDLGDSAILNLRQLAGKVPKIAAARVLMTNECVDSKGRPVRLSFKHTNSILIHLKNAEAQAVEENKIKGDKKPKLRFRAPSAVQEAHATPSLAAAEGDILDQRKPGLPLMTGDDGLSAGSSTVKISKTVKHGIDGGDEQPLKKLKFNKESVEAELKFVKRAIVQKDNHFFTEGATSKAEMKVGKESKAILSAHTAGKKSAFSDISEQEGEGQKEVLRVAAGSDGLLDSGSVNDAKQSEQARKLVGFGQRNRPSADILATNEERVKKRKIRGDILDSPASPKESIGREEHINSSTGRRLSKLHATKRAEIKASDLPGESGEEQSALEERIMDRKVSEASGKAEVRSTREVDPQPTPARGSSSLPLLPEILTARIPDDRALILSIPGILKPYIKELQGAILDGKAPGGDLLSMIIVNKYGYLLEHVDKLDKDLKSLYYEAIDKDEEAERKEDERKSKGRN